MQLAIEEEGRFVDGYSMSNLQRIFFVLCEDTRVITQTTCDVLCRHTTQSQPHKRNEQRA